MIRYKKRRSKFKHTNAFSRFIIKSWNFIWWPSGSFFGSRCSGWGIYPDGRVCLGCEDCSEINKQ